MTFFSQVADLIRSCQRAAPPGVGLTVIERPDPDQLMVRAVRGDKWYETVVHRNDTQRSAYETVNFAIRAVTDDWGFDVRGGRSTEQTRSSVGHRRRRRAIQLS